MTTDVAAIPSSAVIEELPHRDSDKRPTPCATGCTPEDSCPDNCFPSDKDQTASADADAAPQPARARSGPVVAAAAVTAAGFALVSLSGSWLARMLGERQQLIGRIDFSQASPSKQLEAFYGSPWHVTALVDGLFALLAVLLAITALVLPRVWTRLKPPTWVKAIATAGLALGATGLLMAAGLWSDVFHLLPALPQTAG